MTNLKPIRVAVPTGIGDAHWACQKLASLKERHPGRPLHVLVNQTEHHKTEGYIRLLPFVDHAEYNPLAPYSLNTQISHLDERWTRLDGCAGWNGVDYLVAPNGHLETGSHIQDFIPELETQYDFELEIDDDTDKAGKVLADDPRVVIYMSGTGPNTAFHGDWWTPDHWIMLIRMLNRSGERPVLIGAPTWDLEYARRVVSQPLNFVNIIGQTDIPTVMSIIRRAGVWIGLNSGTGIVAASLNVPTIMMWSDVRYPCGEHPGFLPAMQKGWLCPKQLETYRTFSYGNGRLTPENVTATAQELLEAS